MSDKLQKYHCATCVMNEPIQLPERLVSSYFSVAFTKKLDNEHKMQKRMSLTERL